MLRRSSAKLAAQLLGGKPSSVYVTGASGFVGRQVVDALKHDGYYVHHVSRWEGYETNITGADEHHTWVDLERDGIQDNTKAIIHLAGAPLRKDANGASRLEGLECIKAALAVTPASARPEALIVASSVNVYGRTTKGDEVSEDSEARAETDFGKIARSVEVSALHAEQSGLVKRAVFMRQGWVIGNGGLVACLHPWFKWYLGGRLGKCEGSFPFISLYDLGRLYSHTVSHQLKGALNAVSPIPATNSEFIHAFSEVSHRPAWCPLPGLIWRTMGGSSTVGAIDQAPFVTPSKALSSGFSYKYDSVSQALWNSYSLYTEGLAHESHSGFGRHAMH